MRPMNGQIENENGLQSRIREQQKKHAHSQQIMDKMRAVIPTIEKKTYPGSIGQRPFYSFQNSKHV